MSVAGSTTGPISDLAALGQSAIGQRDVRMTPLENAMIAATVANGGVRMQPYLVDKLQGPDLKTLYTTAPNSMDEPISAQTAATLTSLMIDSERNTTGSGGSSVTIASKTGTAEHSATSEAASTPYAWYIAFGPSSNAQIAVAVIVENGDRGVQSTGGSSAAPIAARSSTPWSGETSDLREGERMSLQSGTTIAHRYRLMRLIATGGMGQVWEGLDTRLDRRVAVKVLKSEFSDDAEFLQRFRIEAMTTARLHDPGIASIFDYGETPDRAGGPALAYLVMELVNGEPLNAVLARLGRCR